MTPSFESCGPTQILVVRSYQNGHKLTKYYNKIARIVACRLACTHTHTHTCHPSIFSGFVTEFNPQYGNMNVLIMLCYVIIHLMIVLSFGMWHHLLYNVVLDPRQADIHPF